MKIVDWVSSGLTRLHSKPKLRHSTLRAARQSAAPITGSLVEMNHLAPGESRVDNPTAPQALHLKCDATQ
jgi:hypothetical protein